MECAFCHTDFARPDEVIYLAPRPDGSESVLTACWDCINAQGMYCQKHKRVFSVTNGGGGKGTLCLECVDADMLKHVERAEGFRKLLRVGLPPEEWARVEEWVRDMEEAWDHLDALAILLRGILYEAHRRRVPALRVVEDCVAAGSAETLLPLAY